MNLEWDYLALLWKKVLLQQPRMTLLDCAASQGHLETVRTLLQYKEKLVHCNFGFGFSVAYENQHMPVVELFQQHFTTSSLLTAMPSPYSKEFLQLICDRDDITMTKLLVSQSIDMNLYISFLLTACRKGKLENHGRTSPNSTYSIYKGFGD